MSSLPITTPNFTRGNVRPQTRHSGLTARLALDDQTKADAYAIRHASYLSGGFIDPQPGGLFSDADDLRQNAQSIVVYKGEIPAASARICIRDYTSGLTGWDEIPASRIFPEAVADLAASITHGKPAKIMESNRLVRHPDYATDYHLVFVLYRLVSHLLTETNSDMLLSCVRRNHTPFYKRMHFDYIDGPRRYPGVKFETNLMCLPKDGFDKTRQDFSIIGADPKTLATYAGLLHGETVKVFQED